MSLPAAATAVAGTGAAALRPPLILSTIWRTRLRTRLDCPPSSSFAAHLSARAPPLPPFVPTSTSLSRPPPLLNPNAPHRTPPPASAAATRSSKLLRFKNAPVSKGCDATAPARVLLTEDVAASPPPPLPSPRPELQPPEPAAVTELGVTQRTKQPRVAYCANPRRR